MESGAEGKKCNRLINMAALKNAADCFEINFKKGLTSFQISVILLL